MGLFSKLRSKAKRLDASVKHTGKQSHAQTSQDGQTASETNAADRIDQAAKQGTPTERVKASQPGLSPLSTLREAGFLSESVRDEREPLWWACENGQSLVVEYLVQRDPPHPFLNQPDSSGRRMLLECALEQRYMHTAMILLQNDADMGFRETGLDTAARYGTMPELVNLMLSKWFPNDSSGGIAASRWGMIAFKAASYGARIMGRETCIPFLWENGCSTVAKSDPDFGSVMFELLTSPNTPASILSYIREAGVQSLAQNAMHWYEFNRALSLSYGLEVTTRLLSEGFDPQYSENRYGETALHRACRGNNLPVVALLIDHGAGVNAITTKDALETPLITATRCSATPVLQLLLNQGALVNAVDAKGRTALHWARLKNRKEHIEVLLANGADDMMKREEAQPAEKLKTQPKTHQKPGQQVQILAKNYIHTTNNGESAVQNAKLEDKAPYLDSSVLRWD